MSTEAREARFTNVRKRSPPYTNAMEELLRLYCKLCPPKPGEDFARLNKVIKRSPPTLKLRRAKVEVRGIEPLTFRLCISTSCVNSVFQGHRIGHQTGFFQQVKNILESIKANTFFRYAQMIEAYIIFILYTNRVYILQTY